MRFENVDGASVVLLNTDDTPMVNFTTEVEVRSDDRDKAQEWGMWPNETYLGKRLFHCEGDLFGQDSDNYMQRRLDMVSAILPMPGERKVGTLYIQFNGIPDELHCDCGLDGWPDLPIEALKPAFTSYLINFKAYDPRMYASTIKTQDAPTPMTQAGRTFNLTYPKTYALATGSDIVLTNDGNTSTSPIAIITGPATNPELVLFNPDGSTSTVSVDITLNPGDSLELNFKEKMAMLNNDTNVYNSARTSEWWTLKPGSNTVRYTALGADDPSIATFLWNDAYMI